MKTKLLFTKQQSISLFTIMVFCLCINYGWSQNLMLNGDCDTHGTNMGSTTDNADSYDMTPNNTILDETTGAEVSSPYQAIWDNDPLEDWLEVFYLGMAGSLDEQPGSTSGGNNGTRGVKLYDDGNPVITGCSRRIYQKVEGLSIGTEYTFSVDIRAEATGTPSEIYILNTEIADEVGINANGATDTSVDGFLNVLDDSGSFNNHSFDFTASNTFAVVYIRSLNSVDGATEVFYDNFSLTEKTLSVEDQIASKFKVYPNPASKFININSRNINISSVNVFNVLGTKVLERKELNDNKLDISSLSNGIYFLKISADNTTVTKKFIVE
jgi:hypothetical protein